MSNFVIENRIWEPDWECMAVSDRKKLQLERLKNTLQRAKNIPFYRQAFAEKNINPDDFNSLDDLRKLPFTTKKDLRDNYPFGFFAVDKSKLARLHASSGTTGKPTIVGYTKNDLVTWSNLCARFLTAGGLTGDQIAQVSFGYGLFTGGFGLHYGIERVGAAVVPASSGNTERQIMLMKDIGVNTLICTPSYALNITEVLNANNYKPEDMALRFAHFGGEPWTENMRIANEENLHIRACNNYGLSEIIGPGVSGECACRRGMHIQEDHFIVECLNPDTMEPVADGEYGELVITALTKEACPIIRYRTRDLAYLIHDKCDCGRTTVRMSRLRGRSDDMMIIRGVNVFPSQIEEALLKVDGTAPHFMIELNRPQNLDEAIIKVEIRPQDFSDRMNELQKLRDNIAHQVFTITGLHFKIELAEPNSLQRFTGKASRVIDNRKLKD